MKKPLCIITALCCSLIFLSSCKDKDTYIGIDSDYSVLDSELAEKLEQTDQSLDTTVTDFDSSLFLRDWLYGYSCDDRNLYIFQRVGYYGDENWEGQNLITCTVDLQSGKVSPMCNTPGCSHDDNLYPNCIYNMLTFEMKATKAIDGEIWYIGKDDNDHYTKICTMTNGKSNVFFENTYYTDFEEKALMGNKMTEDDETYKCELKDFFVDDEHIYVCAPSYVFIIDRETKQAGEIINLGDECEIYMHQIYNSKIYVKNDFKELFSVDIVTGEIVKIINKSGDYISIYNDKIYYTIVEFDTQNKAYLWCADLDGNNNQLVKEDILQYVIKEGKLFYIPYSIIYTGEKVLMSYDLESDQETILYEGDDLGGLVFSADHIDRVFVIGLNNDNTDVIISVRTDGSDLWKKTIDPRTALT